MKKSTNLFKKRYMVVGVFALLLGCISIGYATLRETLTIQGDVTITKEKFQVSFENIKITEGSVATTNGATIDESDKNLVTFSNVTLSNSGDFYEFTVDIANTGNVDARIKSIELCDKDIASFTVISQSVDKLELAGEDISRLAITATAEEPSNASIPTIDEVITAGSRKTLKFRVDYDTTLGSAQTINNFSYKIVYEKND